MAGNRIVDHGWDRTIGEVLDKSIAIDTDCHGQFDFVWSACAFEHLGSILNGLEFVVNSVKCLKPGGVVLIQGYGTGQLRFNTGGPGRLEHLYTEDLLVSAFEGYEVLDRCTYEAELAEGAGHAGRSALVGFVASKP